MKVNNIAKRLGRRGGRARAKKLSALERKRIAAQGGEARAESYRAKRIIEENFRYLEFIEQFLPKPKITRVSEVSHPLPGING